MNSKLISNNLLAFRSDITNIKGAEGQLRGLNAKLFSTLDSLNASWDGSAHDVYVDNVQEDRELMERVLKTLTQFGEDLAQANTIYSANEDKVAAEIASIRV